MRPLNQALKPQGGIAVLRGNLAPRRMRDQIVGSNEIFASRPGAGVLVDACGPVHGFDELVCGNQIPVRPVEHEEKAVSIGVQERSGRLAAGVFRAMLRFRLDRCRPLFLVRSPAGKWFSVSLFSALYFAIYAD